MNMRATGSYPAGMPSPTDRRIGDAFPIVEEVHKYLKQLVYLAENSEKFVLKQIEFQANSELGVIEWRYKGDPEWTVLVTYTELLGESLSLMEETLNEIIDNGIDTLKEGFTDYVGKVLRVYDTKSDALTDLANIPEGTQIEITQDEYNNGTRTRYKKESGDLFFEVNLDHGSAPVRTYSTGTAYAVQADDHYLVINRAATVTLTLPLASASSGRELCVKTVQNQAVVSAAANVVPATSSVASTGILPATVGAWALLVSDGTNWVIMQHG